MGIINMDRMKDIYDMVTDKINEKKQKGEIKDSYDIVTDIIHEEIQKCNINLTKIYKDHIDNGNYDMINDNLLKDVAEGGYINDYGFEGVDEGYKPYYEYLKQDLDNRKNNIHEEYNNEQLLLEDNNYYPQYEYIPQQYNYSYDYNNYNSYNYYTPYSYEYDPYIDYYNNYNNGYNTYYNDNINTTVDLTNDTNTFNDSITNVLDMIKSYKDRVNIFKPKHIKKKIINYISNYRPMYNSITGKIEAVLIE